MVQTRTRDHGAFDTKAQNSSRQGAKAPAARDKKPSSKGKASAQKRDHDTTEPERDEIPGDNRNIAQETVFKKVKHGDEGTRVQAHGSPNQSKSASVVNTNKVQDIMAKYGTLPLLDIGLSKPAEATPETIFALVLNAMLTSARISHELAYKSVKCLIEAGYHDVHTLKKSSWEERTEVLTKGGYTRYREKTATALGELADVVLNEYGRCLHA